MTARVSRNEQAVSALMASECESIMTESVLPLMQRSGIKKIEIKKMESALSVKLVPMVEYFDGVPDKFKLFSELVKYPIGDIMALLGVVLVDIRDATEQEVATIVTNCNRIIEASEQAGANAKSDKPAIELNDNMVKKAAELVDKMKTATACSKKGKCSCAPKKK